MAGRKRALAGSLSRHLAQAARGFPPIVCVLAFGTSAAVAQPLVTGTGAAAAPAVAQDTAPYSAQQHDALIAARREGRVTPAQALQQLKAWLAPVQGTQAAPGELGEPERRRIASEAFPISQGAGAIEVTISIGIATLDVADDTAASILKRADQALYRAKRDGRNRVVADAA